jgi:hypothetical protein
VVLTGSANVSGDKRYSLDAVGNTQIVMQFLLRLPENNQSMTKLPSKQVHGTADAAKGSPPKLTPTSDERLIDPPIILDAWNNPVIFVGADGLAGVRFESKADNQDYRVTSTGVVLGTGLADTATRSKSWRPFFASAGPDGDFRTGDDNVYSFQ